MLTNTQFVVLGARPIGLATAYALIDKAGIAGKDITIIAKEQIGRNFEGQGLVEQVTSLASATTKELLRRSRLVLHRLSTVSLPASQHEHHHEHRHGKHHGHLVHHSEGASGLDWHRSGSLRLGLSGNECARLESEAEQAGVEVHVLNRREAEQKLPFLALEEGKKALFYPGDGWISHAGLVRVYEHLLRQAGVQFALDAEVEQVRRHHHSNRVEAVQTKQHGTVECRYLIDTTVQPDLEFHSALSVAAFARTGLLEGLDNRAPWFSVDSLVGRPCEGRLLLHAPPSLSGPISEQPWMDQHRYIEELLAEHLAPAHPGRSALLQQKNEVLLLKKAVASDGLGSGIIVGESKKTPGYVLATNNHTEDTVIAAGIGEAVVESLFSTTPSELVRSLAPARAHTKLSP